MKTIAMITSVLLALPVFVSAQEDDMYFVPNKQKDKAAVRKKEEAGTPHKPVYVITYDDVKEETAGAERDVDEYNRRYYKPEAKNYADTVRLDECDDSYSEEQRRADVYDEAEGDYACAVRLLRFRAPTIGIPVSSRLYWDLRYGPNSIYWDVYDDGWYAYAYPSSWNYWYGHPFAYDWYYGYRGWYPYSFGWGWGWGPHWGYDPWYHHHHHHPYPPMAGGIHRPSSSHVGPNGAWRPARGQQQGTSGRRPVYGTNRPSATRPGRGESTGVQRRPAQSRPSRSNQGTTVTRPTQPQDNSSSRPSRSYGSPSNGGGVDRGGGTISRPSRSGGGGGISMPRNGGGRPRR